MPRHCADGQYNELASLFLVPSEDAIRQLFHFEGSYYPPALVVFTIVYFFGMTLAYGIAVPAGLFIPALLAGSGIGRLVGEIVKQIFQQDFVLV
jgi:chloride channel 7